jgi:DNA-directed RNA polymerase specialized sigma24 family protein
MAISIFWSKMYHGTNWKNLPKGYTQDDIVQESIRRAFSRDWEDVSEAEVTEYLFGAARSILSNLAKSAKVQKTNPSDLFTLDVADDSISIEEKFDQDELIQKIRENLISEKDLLSLFDDILLGLSPQEIEKKQNIPIKEIYNRKKRLLRVVEKVANEN